MEQIMEQQGERDEKGRYLAGRISERKGQSFLQIKREKHYNWKGGNRCTAKRMAKEYGMDFEHCQICKENIDKPVIHHHNGNYYDNRRCNLCILCHFCHNAIHDNPHRRETQFKVGHKVSEETRKKISMANKGKIAWNKGRKS